MLTYELLRLPSGGWRVITRQGSATGYTTRTRDFGAYLAAWVYAQFLRLRYGARPR